jgi:type II secretory ATPase GspE/PulE/Tfp pilus assembly ATPase PilB-like protein
MNMGAKPYMISGTFNLVMAQRLARTICPVCKAKINIKEKDPRLYKFARETISNIEKDFLRKEMQIRKVPSDAWTDFVKE